MINILEAVLCMLLISGVNSAECGKGSSSYDTRIRYYCIAVVDVDWDYAIASTEDQYDLTGLYEESASNILNDAEAPSLGKYARKGLLRQFPYVATLGGCNWNEEAILMSTEIDRNGILGPVIRGVAGDLIKVFFYNNAKSVYDGVGADKGDDDGALLDNAVFNLVPAGIVPSQTTSVGYLGEVMYEWTLPNLSGVSSTQLYSYGSTAYQNGFDTGLMGAIIVVNPAYIVSTQQRENAQACDVDAEVFLTVAEISEARSLYYKYNVVTKYNKFNGKYTTEPAPVLSNVRRTLNGYMFGNLNADLGMEFMYMNRIRWNVLTFNTTISIQTNDKWEEKRDEKNLGPEEGWGEVTLRWGGSDVTLLSHSSTSKSVTLPGTFAATIDMIAETAGDFLITVDGYEQYGAMAQFSVIDDGTYVPKSPKTSNKDEEFSSDAVAAISVIMCSVAVVIFVILYIARQKRSNQYTKTLDDSSTIVFNPVLGMNSSHSSGGSVQCSWCSGPHSAQDCKALREYTHNSKKGSVPGDAPTSSHSKSSDTELMPLDNI